MSPFIALATQPEWVYILLLVASRLKDRSKKRICTMKRFIRRRAGLGKSQKLASYESKSIYEWTDDETQSSVSLSLVFCRMLIHSVCVPSVGSPTIRILIELVYTIECVLTASIVILNKPVATYTSILCLSNLLLVTVCSAIWQDTWCGSDTLLWLSCDASLRIALLFTQIWQYFSFHTRHACFSDG